MLGVESGDRADDFNTIHRYTVHPEKFSLYLRDLGKENDNLKPSSQCKIPDELFSFSAENQDSLPGETNQRQNLWLDIEEDPDLSVCTYFSSSENNKRVQNKNRLKIRKIIYFLNLMIN